MEDKSLETRTCCRCGCTVVNGTDHWCNPDYPDKSLERSVEDGYICLLHRSDACKDCAKELATLQSQITALKEQNMKLSMPEGGAVDEFIQYHHNPIVGQMNNKISKLKAQLDSIKQLLSGASLHPETGVSLVDDVRDLVKDIAGYKAQVAGQAHYISCLLEEIRQLKEKE